MVKAIIRYRNGKLYLEKASIDIKNRFGLSETGYVDPIIALYLAYSSNAKIIDSENRELDLDAIIRICEENNRALETFFVFLDLVKRGKKVRPGIQGNEIVIEDEKIRIYAIDESSRISVKDLYTLVDRSIKQGYRVIIALVDLYGDVTYYEVNKMDFQKIEKKSEII